MSRSASRASIFATSWAPSLSPPPVNAHCTTQHSACSSTTTSAKASGSPAATPSGFARSSCAGDVLSSGCSRPDGGSNAA